MTALAICIAALVMDQLAGEPRRWHPLVGFGGLAARAEARLNQVPPGSLPSGAAAVALLVLPMVAAGALIVHIMPGLLAKAAEALLLWLALGLQSLTAHARSVSQALHHNDRSTARESVGRMVSRDTTELDDTGVATATTESVLENGADAVFASLFWYLIAGIPGVILHRCVNTLDAMWGYRTPRYERFGKTAARLDDLLNWAPARLTALSYALAGDTRTALRCWRNQSRHWDSPNAGPVMAAGAGALNVTLGGPARYRDGWRERPRLGSGNPATADTIEASLQLVRRATALWLLAIFSGALTWHWIMAAV